MTSKHQIPDSHTIRFFHELKSELPYASTRKIVTLVRTILSKLKSTSSSQPISMIKHETSPVLHLLSECHDNQGDKNQEIIHLDELVDHLYIEDRCKTEGKQLFKSEVEALSIITKVLQKIGVLFSDVGMKPFTHTFTHELQQATQESF